MAFSTTQSRIPAI